MNRQRGGSTSTAPFGFKEAGARIIGPEDHPEIDSPPELIVSVTGGPSINTNHLGDFDRGDFTFRHVGTKIAGSHELRFGGEAVNVRNHLINTFQMAGRVAFSGQLSGNGMADFMFGRTNEFRQGGGEFKDLKGTRWGFFIQDNWTASPRLTVNLGFRWDPYLSPWDREGRVICFDPDLAVCALSERSERPSLWRRQRRSRLSKGRGRAGVDEFRAAAWCGLSPDKRRQNHASKRVRHLLHARANWRQQQPVEHGALRRHLYLERRGLGGSVSGARAWPIRFPNSSVRPCQGPRPSLRRTTTSPTGTPTAAFLRCTRIASVWSGSS